MNRLEPPGAQVTQRIVDLIGLKLFFYPGRGAVGPDTLQISWPWAVRGT
jgi:hypothetical protein